MPTSMSPADVVKTFTDAVAVKDCDSAFRFVADDCDYENMPLAKVKGPAAMRGVLEPFFAPTLENEFIVLRQAEAGPVVFVERLDRHRLAEGWVELPVTGVFEVRDGRITLWRDYFDVATLLKAWPALAQILG